jgi:hypothetical protein
MQSILDILQKHKALSSATVEKNQVNLFEKRPDAEVTSL